MPRLKRGSGFKRPKRGRYKIDFGGGRGEKVRSSKASTSTVGELEVKEVISEHSEESWDSTQTDSFRDALLSPDLTQCREGESTFSLGRLTPTLSPLTCEKSCSPLTVPEVIEEDSVNTQVIGEVLEFLKGMLPKNWIAISDSEGFHIMLLSRGKDKAIQRSIYVNFSGSVRLTVHRRHLPKDLEQKIMSEGKNIIKLSAHSVQSFVDRIQTLVMYMRTFEVCAGADYSDFQMFWSTDKLGSVDNNPYDESRYEETFRSHMCNMIVPVRKWRCEECGKAVLRFRKRSQAVDVHPNTPNILLSEDQKLDKLKDTYRQLRNAQRQIGNLQKRFQLSLQSSGVRIHKDLEESLSEILKESNLSPLQELFVQQQYKAASLKNSRSMKWHPTLIRFALSLKSTSSAAYAAVRDSGFLKFPSERTLYDYSHVLPQSEGCHNAKIKRVYDQMAKYPENHQKYHALLMDEIHISQKLVYHKASGEMMGYVNLSEVESEMKHLCDFVSSEDENSEPPLATKMLVYMVKGMTSGVKEVVASFTSSNLSKEDLFDRTWEVITKLEVAGIQVLTLVCDGSSINRSFIQIHKPFTVLPSGVVCDTVHMCAPDRTLHFISDAPHLLKTIRNCLAKSGSHPKCTRKLTKGGQLMAWKTIERLFMEDHENTWRKSFKLNSQIVYLNSYSCMKVSYAAKVLSKTVSMDLKERKWQGTSELSDFILKVNNFFDCINGAHSQHGKRTANERLHPYTSVNDPRFEELAEFLNYLHGWKTEVYLLPNLSQAQKSKMLLSQQTLDGIEMTINSFTSVVKFLLQEGAKFVNARSLCQDPLEQYFGKQRASLGGSNNPNVEQFLNTDLKISVHRDVNVRRQSGNTEAQVEAMKISDEPLSKRKRP